MARCYPSGCSKIHFILNNSDGWGRERGFRVANCKLGQIFTAFLKESWGTAAGDRLSLRRTRGPGCLAGDLARRGCSGGCRTSRDPRRGCSGGCRAGGDPRTPRLGAAPGSAARRPRVRSGARCPAQCPGSGAGLRAAGALLLSLLRRSALSVGQGQRIPPLACPGPSQPGVPSASPPSAARPGPDPSGLGCLTLSLRTRPAAPSRGCFPPLGFGLPTRRKPAPTQPSLCRWTGAFGALVLLCLNAVYLPSSSDGSRCYLRGLGGN